MKQMIPTALNGTAMDDLTAQIRAALDRELDRTDWPHRPTCQMLQNPPKGLFHGFSCNCDAATTRMYLHHANRKMLELHAQNEIWVGPEHDRTLVTVKCGHCCHIGEDYDDVGGNLEWPCPTVLILAEAYGIEPQQDTP